VGRMIRDAELRKVPYMLVVGDREAAADEVSLREHRGGDEGSVGVQQFVDRLSEQVADRS
jgi:threonyl-tRNA synthetase